ncbi:J domain-containing protein [Tropicimonas sediminicola]|uniref:DnaJ domain-containing protein n=1 Tax=Tropicimonas sediminicola TaxID=1031541 RepID=A0A239HB08_9RHOB|nr:J domain-containing protein [Tropicimonas sediminicola]SNS78452.1 DnaJ domain-containing protein [Tropicimonas sediminicola]
MSPIERVRAKAAASEILGVSSHASLEELRAAWRRAAKVLHPDQDGGDTRRFAQAKAAYDLLSNNEPEDLDVAAFARSTRTAPARNASVRRPQVAARVSPLSREILEACEAKLKAHGAAEDASAGRPAGHHVPHSIARKGREITYRIATPLIAGVNRVALPTSVLGGHRREAPAILQFASQKAGAGEIEVPEAILRQRFPGARSIRISFEAS